MNVYEGHLVDEPYTSVVHGFIHDNLFEGRIYTGERGFLTGIPCSLFLGYAVQERSTIKTTITTYIHKENVGQA